MTVVTIYAISDLNLRSRTTLMPPQVNVSKFILYSVLSNADSSETSYF